MASNTERDTSSEGVTGSLHTEPLGRFDEVRRLALPTGLVAISGSLAGWLGRNAFVDWLAHHGGFGPLVGASSAKAFTVSLLSASLGFGFALALPLLAWQTYSLLTPTSARLARSRFWTYLVAAYVCWVANPGVLIVQQQPQGEVLLSTNEIRTFAIPMQGHYALAEAQRIDDYVRDTAFLMGLFALGASLIVPLFAASRHHEQTRHVWYVAIASALGIYAACCITLDRNTVRALYGAAALAPLSLFAWPHAQPESRWAARRGPALAMALILTTLAWITARTYLFPRLWLVLYAASAGLGLGMRRFDARRARQRRELTAPRTSAFL